MLHESFVHMRYKWLSREKRDPSVAPSCVPGVSQMWHQRPCRCPLRPERAPLASWATSAHASLMATTTNDGIQTVHDDAAVDAVAKLQRTWNGPSRLTPLANSGEAHSRISTECASHKSALLGSREWCERVHCCLRYASASRILPPTADIWCCTASHAARCTLRLSRPSRPT